MLAIVYVDLKLCICKGGIEAWDEASGVSTQNLFSYRDTTSVRNTLRKKDKKNINSRFVLFSFFDFLPAPPIDQTQEEVR